MRWNVAKALSSWSDRVRDIEIHAPAWSQRPVERTSRTISRAFLASLILSVPAFAQEQPRTPAPADSVLAQEPTTAAAAFDAALLMARLARMELARHYLDQLNSLAASDEDLIALRDKHGTAAFLELARVEELNSAATNLLNRLTEAVRRQTDATDYAESVIRRLSGSAREQAQAMQELRHLGPRAVPAILKNLDGQLGVSGDQLIVTLARLGSNAVPPLIGALASPDEEIQAVAAHVLGIVGGSDEKIWLWAPAFADGVPDGVRIAARTALAKILYGDSQQVPRVSSDGAAAATLKTAQEFLSGRYQWPEIYDLNEEIPVWSWDEAAGTVVEHPVSRRRAGLHFAERLARDASLLSPTNQEAPLTVLAALLARDIEKAGWNAHVPEGPGSAFDLAVKLGPEACERTLGLALDLNQPAAAMGALQALALNGSANLLRSGSEPRPVIRALNAPHSRVQFAAASAIMHWDPQLPFRDARRVVETFARALMGGSSPEAVVIDANTIRGSETAGLFGELGYRTTLAATGAEGFQIASERGNVQLAVLDPNVIRWELTPTVVNLRADARTANIPIVVFGPEGLRHQARQLTEQFQHVHFIGASPDALAVFGHLQPAISELTPPPLTDEQRNRQTKEAAFWLRRIALRDVEHIFPLDVAENALIQSTDNPRVAEDVIIAMTAIGRPTIQQKLATLATSAVAPTSVRQLAALQLGIHIQRFGRLLSPSQIQSLQSALVAEQQPSVATALAGVIGSLQPTPEAVRRQILDRPMSAAPLVAPPVPQSP